MARSVSRGSENRGRPRNRPPEGAGKGLAAGGPGLHWSRSSWSFTGGPWEQVLQMEGTLRRDV